MAEDLHRQPAHRQLDALLHKDISSRELLDLQLAHIETVNGSLNAVVTLDVERARRAAAAADEHLARTGKPLGALHGLPMTVKDALETGGLRTTCGAADLSDHTPAEDADAVARLRDAGAVLIGKTNVPAYCQDIQTSNGLFGTTANPYAKGRTAGGSSGGPAVAVAAGMAALDVGSDLAGSLRLPAAYCGAFGLRPSHGLVPTRGHIPRSPGWRTSSDMLAIGPLARSAKDLDLLLGALAGPAPAEALAWRVDLPRPRHARLRDYRIGVWADDAYCRVDEATRRLLQQVTGALRTAGARLDETSRPVEMADSDRAFLNLLNATTTTSATEEAFAAEVTAAEDLAEDDQSVRATTLRSRTQRHRDWLLANEERERLRTRWAAFFDEHDVLITPAAPTAAVEDQTKVPVPQRYITVDGERRGYFEQTSWLNLTSAVRLPAAVVPAGVTEDGLPLAVQVIGPYLADRTVIAVAGQLARILPDVPAPPALSAS